MRHNARMGKRLLLPMLLLALTACGDDDSPAIETPIAEKPPVREMTEEEKRALMLAEAIATRPAPVAMQRVTDDATGISIAFPKPWRVDRTPNVVFQAWASKQGALDPDGKYVPHVTVTSFADAERTLEEHVALMRETTPAARPGLKDVFVGPRKLGADDAHTYRYTLPWQDGVIVEEAVVVKHGDRFCIVVASCHKEDRTAFTRTYALILQSLQWREPKQPK